MTDQIEHLSAIEEANYVVAQANAGLDENDRLIDELVTCREKGETISGPILPASNTWTWHRARSFPWRLP